MRGLRRLLADLEVVSALHPSRPREVALVRLEGEQYVLKRKAPPKRRMKRWRARVLGAADILHEARVYRALEKVVPVHFRTPRLIASDQRSFLLLEYLPSDPGRVKSVADLVAVAKAIAEFQRLPLSFRKQPLRHALHRFQSVYATWRYLKILKGVLPPGVERQCIELALRLHRQQPRLRRTFLAHNDLNPENLAPDANGKFVLLDFATVARVHRWMFGDIVAYGFSSKQERWIDPVLTAAYVMEVEAASDFGGVRSDVQLRLALLPKVLHWIQFRSRKKRSCDRGISFVTDILLDDGAYADWYAGLMAEGRAALAATADPISSG